MAHGTTLEALGVREAPQCRHHWLIETPNGATSWGVCKLCGERRQFMNSTPDVFWERDDASNKKDGFVTSYGWRIPSSGADEEDS